MKRLRSQEPAQAAGSGRIGGGGGRGGVEGTLTRIDPSGAGTLAVARHREISGSPCGSERRAPRSRCLLSLAGARRRSAEVWLVCWSGAGPMETRGWGWPPTAEPPRSPCRVAGDWPSGLSLTQAPSVAMEGALATPSNGHSCILLVKCT